MSRSVEIAGAVRERERERESNNLGECNKHVNFNENIIDTCRGVHCTSALQRNNYSKNIAKIQLTRVGAASGSPCRKEISNKNKKILNMAMSTMNGRPKGAPTKEKIKNDNNVSDCRRQPLQNTRNYINSFDNNNNPIANSCRGYNPLYIRKKWNTKKC